MSDKITIAIDGYSSTGKSTIAKKLAQTLEYAYVDTGAMYRAVTWYALEEGYIQNSKIQAAQLIDALPDIELHFDYNPLLKYAEIHLNGENIEKEIRTLRVSKHVSSIAAITEVREKLVDMQKRMGKNKGVVMDGRDIGTVVFPDAELKLFMTASLEVRTKRRYDELIGRGDLVNYEDVLANIAQRDHIDSTRKDSPLVKASDAIEIDNSDLTVDEQFEHIMSLLSEKL